MYIRVYQRTVIYTIVLLVYKLTVKNQSESVLIDSVNVLRIGEVPDRKSTNKRDCFTHSNTSNSVKIQVHAIINKHTKYTEVY